MTARRATRALALAPLLAVAACVSLTGIDDLVVVAADAGTDASRAAADTGAPAADGGTDAAKPAPDASPIGDGGCVAKPLDTNAATTALHLATAPAIDGDLSDWPCGFTAIDSANAAATRGTTTNTAAFAVGWDASGVYFACHVVDPHPESTSTADPYKNDACELFLGPPPAAANGAPAADDDHYIVDYTGLARFYPNYGNGTAVPAGVVVGVSVVADGFNVELFVPSSVIDFDPSAVSSRLFDAQIDDAVGGTGQAGVLFAYEEATADLGACPNATLHQPACDTRQWGTIDF